MPLTTLSVVRACDPQVEDIDARASIQIIQSVVRRRPKLRAEACTHPPQIEDGDLAISIHVSLDVARNQVAVRVDGAAEVVQSVQLVLQRVDLARVAAV